MPKDPVAASELKEQRIKKAHDKAKILNASSGRVSLHVLGNGAPGNPSALYVSTDHHKYLFNCGEGTQRLFIELGHKIGKLSQIFLTQTTWEHTGGLLGLSRKLQVIGMPSMAVHTPRSILKLYEMTKLFSVTAELNVDERLPKDVMYTDSNLSVIYVPLKKNSQSDKTGKGKKITGDEDLVLNYIVKLSTLPGKLNIEKCFRLKIPKGPALGELKNGKDYVFPDGRIVKSSDVTDPDDPGPVFLVIDCPTVEYLDSLLNSEQIERHIKTEVESHIPSHVIHFSPQDVLRDSRYIQWMNRFPETTFHFGINEGNNNAAFLSVSNLQTQLRLLDPVLFPVVYIDDKKLSQEGSFVPTETNHQMLLRPYNVLKYDDTAVPVYNEETAVKTVIETEGVPEAIQSFMERLVKLEQQSEVYPIINFLGTASAQPGKDRNTSFILINIDSETSMIFDCGEGSFGQMFRFFGPEKVGEELKKVKAIFVSHLHTDHYLGLITLIQQRSKYTDDPVTLILPQAVHNWLLAYDSIYEPLKHLFVCKQSENFMSRTPFDGDFLSTLKLSRLQTVRVKHCRDSFGISITTKGDNNSCSTRDGDASTSSSPQSSLSSPFKIVYSGDAMPTPFLAVVGKDCDVLIHEATMDDDLLDDAIIKRHSTTSQAIEMGRSMNAKYTILTHFSQRYEKIPMINEDVFEVNSVGCAFDNMRIKRCDLPRMILLHKPLRIMFNDKQLEMVERVQKRNLKRQVEQYFLKQEQR